MPLDPQHGHPSRGKESVDEVQINHKGYHDLPARSASDQESHGTWRVSAANIPMLTTSNEVVNIRRSQSRTDLLVNTQLLIEITDPDRALLRNVPLPSDECLRENELSLDRKSASIFMNELRQVSTSHKCAPVRN
jgi:hypothetical protein